MLGAVGEVRRILRSDEARNSATEVQCDVMPSIPAYAAQAMSRPLWVMRRFGSVGVLEAACR
jgi:hypothetical protein